MLLPSILSMTVIRNTSKSNAIVLGHYPKKTYEGLSPKIKTCLTGIDPETLLNLGERSLYVAQKGKHTKIGVSANPEKRVAQLKDRSGKPLKAWLLKVWPLSAKSGRFEFRLHQKFAEYRDPNFGAEKTEWYRLPLPVLRDLLQTGIGASYRKFELDIKSLEGIASNKVI